MPGSAGPLRAASPVMLSPQSLVAWGEAYGRAAHAPRVVAIAGDLGAGKTTVVQAIARGYGVTEPVTSPTFALVHEYTSPRGHVYHLDLYRLEGPAALETIGWDEIVNADALVLVEWPERAGPLLPDDVQWLTLAHVPGDAGHRTLTEGR
jgi:tRNA threonylcarbamoyladenosine biosynthesis protein TsaE